jgi:hypothetical protein
MIGTLLLALMVVTPTDQTVQVAKGTKLDVNNFAGDVNIKVWDKDAVRVEANNTDRETVDIKQGEQTVTIRSRSLRGGRPRSLDYTISVPSWMAITVAGTYTDVTMDGVGGDVSVDTTHGDIKVRGGSGFVSLKSVQGEITLEKSKGRAEVRAMNESIHLADINGDLSAESTNGSIILDRIDSSNVDLYTVNGNISYDGAIKDKGLYRLTTHNGLIAMPIADKANVTLTVRTYNGGFRSTFPIDPRPETERKRRADNHKDKANLGAAMIDRLDLVAIEADVARAMAEAQPEIDRAVDEAMREVGPEIDRAVSEAMAEVHAVVPHLMPMPNPRPMPMPRPLPRR